MQSSNYIEDIYLEVFEKVIAAQANSRDINPAVNFYTLLESNKPITQAQAEYIIRILTKYQAIALGLGINYTDNLLNPTWKSPFRVIDQSKHVYIEKDSNGELWICLKFPFQLKKAFDEEIAHVDEVDDSHWDPDRKLRILSFYRYNIMHIYDFVKTHNFIIDDSFIDAIDQVEEIWQQADQVIPTCNIVDGQVFLDNINNETADWWKHHSTGILENDLLLAKVMGCKFLGIPSSLAEKIAASSESHFWIKDIRHFLDLCINLQGRVVIILDRSYDPRAWVKSFIEFVDEANFSKLDIKVCFRTNKEQDDGFNEWVKSKNIGGTVDQGKILIFDHKPAKWLFKQEEDVKMLVTNNLYPHTHSIARHWINSHPCVVYLGDIKPTLFKDRTIVEL
jgi:hypothetical protein